MQIIGELIAQVRGEGAAGDGVEPATLSEAGDALQHKFRAGLPLGTARHQLDAFRRECEGELLRDDDNSYEFLLAVPASFWQTWRGQQPGLHVRIQLTRQHPLSATPIDVAVSIRAVACGSRKAAQVIQDPGAGILEGLRAVLLVNSEKRLQDRLLWPHPVQVCPVEQDGKVAGPIACRGKDISTTGSTCRRSCRPRRS